MSPRVAFLDHQRLILNVDNSALKQRIAALAQDKLFKDGKNLEQFACMSSFYKLNKSTVIRLYSAHHIEIMIVIPQVTGSIRFLFCFFIISRGSNNVYKMTIGAQYFNPKIWHICILQSLLMVIIIFKMAAHQEALKKEIERLRRVYQDQSLKKMDHDATVAPPPEAVAIATNDHEQQQ